MSFYKNLVIFKCRENMNGPSPFLNSGTLAGSACALAPGRARAQTTAPAVITRDAIRPQMARGIQSGDPQADGAVI
jgi:alkaline phosphatase D